MLWSWRLYLFVKLFYNDDAALKGVDNDPFSLFYEGSICDGIIDGLFKEDLSERGAR